MKTIKGIVSVDFKIKALGHGVVNWNGPTILVGENRKEVKNHTMPKLRGYTNLTGEVKENGYKYKKDPTDIDFKETPLYVSQNCIRHHLFKSQAFDGHFAKRSNANKMLASVTGLIRGYMIPSCQCKRTSPLLIEDFVDQLGNGNFEQFGQIGERDNSSFFSKTTFGDTEYISYGSINVEELQFISLDKKFDREAVVCKDNEGEKIAKEVEDFIKSLDESKSPKVTFHNNFVRKGTIFEEGEAGLLLNNDAIEVLVQHTLTLIINLSIRQAKSYLYVESVLVDFNDSHRMMRIKQDESLISEEPESEYALYYYQKD